MSKRSEPRAGESGTPRSPVVSVENLKQHKEALADKEIWQLSNRLEELERLRKVGVLNTPFIALEALGALSVGLLTGRSEEQLQTAWPKEWGTATVTVPLALIHALREGWVAYKQAPSGKTLGEALQIEGGAAGRHPMKSKLATIDRSRRLARQVLEKYLQLKEDENSISVNDAIFQVANDNEISFQTVEDAYRKHRKHILPLLEELEIIEGVKSSRS